MPPPPQQYNNHFLQHSRPAVPSVRDKVPAPDAPSIYEQYNSAQNGSLPLYQSLVPGFINQELIGAIRNNPIELGAPQVIQTPQQTVAVPQQNEKESVQLVYVPLENLNPTQPLTQGSQNIYRQVKKHKKRYNDH